MTPEQRYDRWERIARLCYEAAVRSSRELRPQTKNLKLYADALTKCEAAKREQEELPGDSERKEKLLKARQILEDAREELRRCIADAPRRLPG